MKYTNILTLTLSLAGLSSLLTGAAAQIDTGILVAGYDGFVRTLSLQNNQLSEINKTTGCGANPTWLSLDFANQRLWCLDEGWNTVNGSLNTFDIEDNLRLQPYQSRNVSAGPVQSNFFAKGSQIAIAQFGGGPGSNIRGGLTVHSIVPEGKLQGSPLNITFDALPQPGPQKGQDVPRGHGVVVDPTGRHLVVTNYGADKLHVFHITKDGKLVKGPEMETPPGSAPRHAQFLAAKNNATYLFVLSEIANTVTTYNVTYDAAHRLHLFPPSRVIDTLGGNATTETRNVSRAGEIQISPDKRFLMVSNRLDKFTPTSDSLSTFAINADGSLTFLQRIAVGGSAPRHFVLNKKGNRVLVSVTANSTVVVFERDVKTGLLREEALASFRIDTAATPGGDMAGVPMAVWYE
jgi:6-phosphogluconolactonase (cycloisomerase 2 family)